MHAKGGYARRKVLKGIRKLLQTSFPPHMNTQGRLVEYKQNAAIGGERERDRWREIEGERDKERE